MNTVITAETFFLQGAGLVSGDFGPPTRTTLSLSWSIYDHAKTAQGMAEHAVFKPM